MQAVDVRRCSAEWGKNINMRERVVVIAISKLKPGERTRYKVTPMSNVLYEMLLEMSKENMTGKLFSVAVSALKDAFDRAVRKQYLRISISLTRATYSVHAWHRWEKV